MDVRAFEITLASNMADLSESFILHQSLAPIGNENGVFGIDNVKVNNFPKSARMCMALLG